MTNQPPEQQSLSAWIENVCSPPSNGEYHEDPLPMPRLSVEEAYTLNLCQTDVHLAVYWSSGFESQEYPSAKRVIAIDFQGEANGHRLYHVHTNVTHVHGIMSDDDSLTVLPGDNPQATVLYGLWLKLYEALHAPQP